MTSCLFFKVSLTRLYGGLSVFNLKVSVTLLAITQCDIHSVITSIINNKCGMVWCRYNIVAVNIYTVRVLDDNMGDSHIIIKGDG